MCTRIIKSIILIMLSFFVLCLEAKTIRAKDYNTVIGKVHKKNGYGIVFDYIGMQRMFLLGNIDWGYDNLYADTLYVCDVVNMNSSSYNEYLITSERIYSIENNLRYSMRGKVYSVQERNEIRCHRLIDYVRNWDVELFKRWNSTKENDYTYVNAMRIIRLSKHKFKYDFYTFYDNYWVENDPFSFLDD